MTSTSMSSELKSHGIVVGVDGSPASRVATDWAARDAALRRVPLTVVHVLPADEIGPLDIPVSDDYLAERDRRAQQIIADALRVVAGAVSDTREVLVDHRVLTGPKVPALVDMSKDADVVVVGCRGIGGVQGLLLGSVSSGLVHHAHCPVAVIHDEELMMDHPATGPVAVGIDGSPASELVRPRSPSTRRRGVGLNWSLSTPG